ncbi:MAG: hypothetical protein JWM87_1750 [Candidatus Eremiobacteraeota bacterium]|jgi:hypothetical protein|nr:hypothetical protein [Candidatus Eremiobacteraeota bacterium]
MPRYMVERTFPDGLNVPTNSDGAAACLNIVGKNAGNGVTWVHSYVSSDNTKTFCIYDGPDENSIRDAAQATGLPVDAVTKVSVLDPYFYHS